MGIAFREVVGLKMSAKLFVTVHGSFRHSCIGVCKRPSLMT
ncbi:MAG: hypothetical protein ACRC46_04810 [Thermoguttaceae bacterium]